MKKECICDEEYKIWDENHLSFYYCQRCLPLVDLKKRIEKIESVLATIINPNLL